MLTKFAHERQEIVRLRAEVPFVSHREERVRNLCLAGYKLSWCISNFPIVVVIVIGLTAERLSFVASELNGLQNVRVKEISFSIISEFPRYHPLLKAIFVAADIFSNQFPKCENQKSFVLEISFQEDYFKAKLATL